MPQSFALEIEAASFQLTKFLAEIFMRRSSMLCAIILSIFTFNSLVSAQAGEVIGVWKTGGIGTIGYQNQITGSVKPGRGNIFWYKFLSNGNFEFVGYMESTMYNCTTSLFNQITGRYRVNGNRIELLPNKDFWKSTNSCAASGNRQTNKRPTPKTLTFERRQDEYGQKLLCLTDGGVETCYREDKNWFTASFH